MQKQSEQFTKVKIHLSNFDKVIEGQRLEAFAQMVLISVVPKEKCDLIVLN